MTTNVYFTPMIRGVVKFSARASARSIPPPSPLTLFLETPLPPTLYITRYGLGHVTEARGDPILAAIDTGSHDFTIGFMK